MLQVIATTLRLPKELLGSLKQEAKNYGLTLNALLLQILWEWVNNR